MDNQDEVQGPAMPDPVIDGLELIRRIDSLTDYRTFIDENVSLTFPPIPVQRRDTLTLGHLRDIIDTYGLEGTQWRVDSNHGRVWSYGIERVPEFWSYDPEHATALQSMQFRRYYDCNYAPPEGRLITNYDRPTQEAEEKAKQLLLSMLNQEQKDDYNTLGYFHVIGSVTGERYEIRQVKNQGIHDMHGVNYCIIFKNNIEMPVCDLMLAQKLLIETQEDVFLNIAVKTTHMYDW